MQGPKETQERPRNTNASFQIRKTDRKRLRNAFGVKLEKKTCKWFSMTLDTYNAKDHALAHHMNKTARHMACPNLGLDFAHTYVCISTRFASACLSSCQRVAGRKCFQFCTNFACCRGARAALLITPVDNKFCNSFAHTVTSTRPGQRCR
jgi:hypothetical protein